MQPRHAENRVISSQGQRNEIEAVGIRADDDGGGWNEGSSGLLAPICECNDVLRRQRHRQNVMLVDESIIDEVASGAAVNEKNSWATGQAAAQLDERTRRGSDLIDL
jgi:hypothetical protein